ncbi:MAG: tripartite tricarboxylate transporter substrate-binding protein [Betaproteobacteria bacterium]
MFARKLILIPALLACVALNASAQDDKSPVRLMVGLAAGGPNDIAARLIGGKLREIWGRPVVVENKVGAGQRIALSELRRAVPDGRTLQLVTNSPFTIYPHIYSKLDYDPVKDFTPIARVLTFDMGVATGPMTNALTMKQFVDWASSNRNRAAYGSPGAGTLPHFLGVALGDVIGIPLTHVPYRGGNPASVDLIGGQVPLIIIGLSDLIEVHKAGKVKVLAVTGDRRSSLMPEVPTLKESGVNLASVISVGIYGPPKMPPDLVRRLNTDILKAVNAPELQDQFARAGLNLAPLSAEDLASAQNAEYVRLQALVKASGYQPE